MKLITMTNIKTCILNYKYILGSLILNTTTMQHQIWNKEIFYDKTQICVLIDTFIFNLPFWDGSIYAV